MYENVELPLTYRGMAAATSASKRVQDSLEKVGMAHRMKHFPSQLSGGQQQRVAVARAIGGLAADPAGRRADRKPRLGQRRGGHGPACRDLHRGGATICMVTHDPRFAQHAGRTIHLFDGRVVEDVGTREEVRKLESSGFEVS